MNDIKFKWVTLQVADLEKSMDFYKKVIGLELDRQIENGPVSIAMMGDKHQPKVELLCNNNVPKVDNPGNGISFGLEMDAMGIAFIIDDNGLEVEGPFSPNEHMKFWFVTDPDGYKVQLIEQK